MKPSPPINPDRKPDTPGQNAEEPTKSPPSKNDGTAYFEPGQPSGTSWYGTAAVAVLLFLWTGLVLWRRAGALPEIVDDSDDFKKALNIWGRVVANKPGTTPRTLKRFLNRVRYFAMRERVASQEDKIYTPIPEDMLVALAALHHLDENWLDRDRFVDELESLPTNTLATLPGSAGDIRTAMKAHDKEFDGFLWSTGCNHLERFRQLSDGILVS
ncbi:MAG: hypothetical protein ABT940_12380 [Alphaproteobacteria bacterium]